MKFFIDTANLDQIREANDLGILDGVTTNPSLMAKGGDPQLERAVQEILDSLKKNPPTAPKKPVYPKRSGF